MHHGLKGGVDALVLFHVCECVGVCVCVRLCARVCTRTFVYNHSTLHTFLMCIRAILMSCINSCYLLFSLGTPYPSTLCTSKCYPKELLSDTQTDRRAYKREHTRTYTQM